MYLLLWGTFLSLCSILISPLVELLIYISCTITDYERQLCQDIRILKQELSQISMVDEFAEYARTERKINKNRKRLAECSNSRSVQRSKANWAFKICFNSLLALSVFITMWSWSSSPVISLPPHWVSPVGWCLALPTGVPGGVRSVSVYQNVRPCDRRSK